MAFVAKSAVGRKSDRCMSVKSVVSSARRSGAISSYRRAANASGVQ